MSNTASTKGLLRETLREILVTWHPNEATDEQLQKLIKKALPFAVSEDDYRAAREWNQASGYIKYRYDDEDELDYWIATQRGIDVGKAQTNA